MDRLGSSERLYRALVGLYPSAFRLRFADEMVQLFGDRLRDARAARAPFGVAMVWFRGLGDLVVTATSEHVRGSRGVGDSIGGPPTGLARLLGVVGVLGGLGILAAFVVQTLIFETLPWLITVRIVLFNAGAIAVIAGLQASVSGASVSRPGTAVAWAAALSNAWYAGVTMLPVIGWAPFAGDHHLVGFLAGLAMWITDAAFGLLVARRGGILRLAGLTLTFGSVLTLLGIDRLGLTNGDLSAFFVPLALAGQGIGGIAWVLLGIDVATRRRGSSVEHRGGRDAEGVG
jgi:hypothetical protein